jgi:hypothetical protein
LFELCRLWRYQ